MATDLVALIKTLFVDKLDHTLSYIAITILLFFYGFSIVKKIIRNTEGSKTQKFIIFVILVIFGINLLLVFFTNFVLSIIDSQLKWIVIIGLVIWSFIKFDQEIIHN